VICDFSMEDMEEDDRTLKPGESIIPASKRPDGSVRKERRVRAGYVPPDEVPVYASTGKQWADSKPKLPPGMDPEIATSSGAKSKAALKNEKRKQKRKEAATGQPGQ